MHTKIRRALTATALAAAAAVPMIGTAPAAQAATTNSWVAGSAYTWHCTAHLYAYDYGPNSLSAAGRLSSATIYQKDGKMWCLMEVDQSTNGGKTWHNVNSNGNQWYIYTASNQVRWSPQFSDPAGRLTRVCLDEEYSSSEYPYYDSGWRCTAAW